LERIAVPFPIVRQGIIASRIIENLKDRGMTGNDEERVLRAFLIDGAIIPGSSGSPVILKPTMGRYIGKDYLVENFPSVLLGIVAEYRIGFIEQKSSDYASFANLGMVCCFSKPKRLKKQSIYSHDLFWQQDRIFCRILTTIKVIN
jgi:hypothetical protein